MFNISPERMSFFESSTYSTFQQKETHFDSTSGPRIQHFQHFPWKRQIFLEKALSFKGPIFLQTCAFSIWFSFPPQPSLCPCFRRGRVGWVGVGDWSKVPLVESLRAWGGEGFLVVFFSFLLFRLLDWFWCCSCFCFSGFLQLFVSFVFLSVLVCFVCLCWSVFVIFVCSCCVLRFVFVLFFVFVGVV